MVGVAVVVALAFVAVECFDLYSDRGNVSTITHPSRITYNQVCPLISIVEAVDLQVGHSCS